MAVSSEHPTIASVRAKPPALPPSSPIPRDDLRALCQSAGADDCGFVAIDRPELDDQRDDILRFFPRTRTLISLAFRMNREPVLNPARSVANLEFHQTTDHANAAARLIVANLALRGVRAVNPSAGFPMEMAQFPGKVWVVSHKPVAVAAGLGQMGIHRNVIHPRFGSFIVLGTILLDADVAEQSRPIDYNPCLGCNLCVAACPVGAISEHGFNFASCYTHNYREFMGGFTDWVEQIADSRSAADHRARISDADNASMWQSLAYGPNYKAAYCLSVCPAGEDVIRPFLDDQPGFVRDIVKPLQSKRETIYVQHGSDAEAHVAKRFPHKAIAHTGGVLRISTIQGLIDGMPHVFQPGQSEGLNATFHFRFTGAQSANCTVTIRDRRIEVRPGLVGTPDATVRAVGTEWLKYLRRDRSLLRMLATRTLRLSPLPRAAQLLTAFGKCFPR